MKIVIVLFERGSNRIQAVYDYGEDRDGATRDFGILTKQGKRAVITVMELPPTLEIQLELFRMSVLMTNPILQFSVEINPVGKQRARVTRNGTYTPQATVTFEARIRSAAQDAMEAAGLSQFDNVELGLWVEVYFGAGRRADTDNVAKAVLDGLQQKSHRKLAYIETALYKSDNRVRSLVVFEAGYKVVRPHIDVTVFYHRDLKNLLEQMKHGTN